MIALDYFLYDNLTWSAQWGRDWGIKAATGILATRPDLKTDFNRYCGAMPGERGLLGGFGASIGGIRSHTRSGYLLCVAAESTDSFGRPSWAVVGLWCPDTATLESVLNADPIGSVKAILGTPKPPAKLNIRPGGTIQPRRHRQSRATFHRFQSEASVAEVISILLGAIQSKSTLPNILGITATSRLTAAAQAGFQRVYSHPMDERAERALERLLTPEGIDDMPEPPPFELRPSRPRSRSAILQPGASEWSVLPWLAIGLIIAVMGFVWVNIQPNRSIIEDSAGETTIPEPNAARTRSTRSDPGLSRDEFLRDVKQCVKEMKSLEPQALRNSGGFITARDVPVEPRFANERTRVREAYETLFEVRQRMVERPIRVSYYFVEEGETSNPELKYAKVGAILREAPLGGEACQAIEQAFGAEFEERDSVARRWCDSLRKLESAVARSSQPLESP